MIEALSLLSGAIVVGVVSGMLGLGGGVFIIPLLTLWFGLPIKAAVAISLACVIPTSMAASNVYFKSGTLDLDLAITLSLFTTIGGVIGGIVAGAIDPAWLELLFAAVLLYSAISIFARRDNGVVVASAISQARRRWLYLAGVGAGTLTGLIGLGGGIILIPLMYIGFRLPMAQAVGSSALIVGVAGTAAATVHFLRGSLESALHYLPPAVIGMIIGAHLGGRIGVKMKSLYLRIGFAAILLYSFYHMLRSALDKMGVG